MGKTINQCEPIESLPPGTLVWLEWDYHMPHAWVLVSPSAMLGKDYCGEQCHLEYCVSRVIEDQYTVMRSDPRLMPPTQPGCFGSLESAQDWCEQRELELLEKIKTTNS